MHLNTKNTSAVVALRDRLSISAGALEWVEVLSGDPKRMQIQGRGVFRMMQELKELR